MFVKGLFGANNFVSECRGKFTELTGFNCLLRDCLEQTFPLVKAGNNSQ